MNQKSKKYVTVAEAAEILGVHKMTAEKWLKDGRLKGVKRARVVSYETMIARDSVSPIVPICLHCGVEIKNAKTPCVTKYCCVEHRQAYLYQQRKRKKKSER